MDLLQNPEFYSTRTITDSTSSGAAVGTLPASNLFNRNLGKPWKRTGLASADTCKLDLDLVRVRPDGQAESGAPQCAGIGMVIVAGISAVTSTGRYPYQINVSFHATTNAFADSGGTNPYDSPGTNTLGPPTTGAVRSVFMSPSDGYSDTVGGVPYDFGSSGSKIGRYIRIMVTPFWSGGGTCDVSIGRILVMSTIKGTPLFDGHADSAENNSETVLAFDGTPYTLARTSSRKIGFTISRLSFAQVNYSPATAFQATTRAANRLMSAGADAALVTNDSSGVVLYDFGTLGRLESPLAAVPLVGTSAGEPNVPNLYQASGTIIETPF